MTEPTDEGGLSLLPYLDSRAPGLRLTLTHLAADEEQAPSTGVLDASGPFTALWNARITLDGIHALSEVFLLIQPDRYTQAPSALPPMVNPQVEAFWQAAAVRLQAQEAGRGPLLLPGQTDSRGALIALRPLFYCRHLRRFGHAPCPQCGGMLTLCRDDRMLRAAGLPAYSDSLARFLFCPACQEGQPRFYAREVSGQAPDHLSDARQLVEAFSRLLGREVLRAALPCVGCSETTACYGPQTLVHQRMAPLCFYPFHMLMLPAPTVGSDYVFKMWLNDLRREMQALLFDTVPAAAVAPQPVAPPVPDTVDETAAEEENARIAGILRTILAQWPDDGAVARKRAPAVAPPPEVKIPATPLPDEDGDSVQTIILGAAPPPPSPDMAQTILIQRPAATAAKPSSAEDLQATVLISPAPAGPAKQAAEQDLEKTVLMRPSEAQPKVAGTDDLEQTVLMTPSTPGPRPPRTLPSMPSKAAPAAPPPPPQADDLAETVIISPDPKGKRSKP